MRCFTWLCRQRKRWPNKGSLLDRISLRSMMPLESGREFLGFERDCLISHRLPVQFLAPADPLCPVSQPTPHKEATGRPDSRTMGRSDPTRKMNARILDSDGWGLTRSRGLWYVPVQAKRPFIIPIPDKWTFYRKHHKSFDASTKLFCVFSTTRLELGVKFRCFNETLSISNLPKNPQTSTKIFYLWLYPTVQTRCPFYWGKSSRTLLVIFVFLCLDKIVLND